MKRGSGEILQRVADITNFLQAREGVRVLTERQVGGWVGISMCICECMMYNISVCVWMGDREVDGVVTAFMDRPSNGGSVEPYLTKINDSQPPQMTHLIPTTSNHNHNHNHPHKQPIPYQPPL